jgi:hypothetical protein
MPWHDPKYPLSVRTLLRRAYRMRPGFARSETRPIVRPSSGRGMFEENKISGTPGWSFRARHPDGGTVQIDAIHDRYLLPIEYRARSGATLGGDSRTSLRIRMSSV